MEGSDPFAGGVEVSSDDPFAGGEFGDFEQHDPELSPGENGAGELKTVDKEGNELPPGQAPAEPEAAPAPAEAAQEATPDPTPPSTESSPPATGAASSEPTSPASEPSTGAAAAATPESTPASTGEQTTPGASQEQSEGDQGSPTTASPAPPSPAATSSSSSSESDEEEDAPLPEEPKDKRGRATARRYIILRVDGPGKFTQVHWYEDDKGKMLTKREPGSKRQTVALCKSAEEALKIGYAACNAPPDGVNLVATAALHFQPKVVKPMPPEPSKQRLQIS